jgi:hypothetical protein
MRQDEVSHIVFRTIRFSAEATDLGRPYWILHPVSWHTPEAATTVFKYSWGWRQKASETCRVILQLLINILPSCIALVLYIYWLMMHGSSNIKYQDFLDFKLSLGSECCILSFLVIPGPLNFMCRRFETLYLFHLHRWFKQLTSPLNLKHGVPKCRHIKFGSRESPIRKNTIPVFNTVY